MSLVMPSSVLSDNGSQFAGFKHGFTMFEKFLMNNTFFPYIAELNIRKHKEKLNGFMAV